MIHLSRGWPVLGEVPVKNQNISSPITFTEMLQNTITSLSSDKETEDFVTLLIDNLTEKQKTLLYKMLYNNGFRINK